MSNDNASRDHRQLNALRGQLKVLADYDDIAPDAQVRLVAALLAGVLVEARLTGIGREMLDQLARAGEDLALSLPEGTGSVDRAPLTSLFAQSLSPAPDAADEEVTATVPLPGDMLVDDLFDNLTAAAPDVPISLPPAALTPVEAVAEFAHMPSTQEVDLTEIGRRHVRLEASDRVVVQLAGREELKDLYLRDISQGGMFVTTEDPPPIGAILTVTLQTPARRLQLPARVVHVKAQEDQHGPSGVGIAFDPLDEVTRDHLEHHIGEIALPSTSVESDAEDAARAAADVGAVDRARQLLRGVENNKLYDAIGVDASADAAAISEHIDNLTKTFETSAERAGAADKVRYQNAARLLARLAKILQDEKRRLAYDFQHGHERVNERLQDVKSGTTNMAVLCGVWRKVHPERAKTANTLVAGALEAEKRGDYITAATSAIEAVALDPFFLPLREKATSWAAMEEMTLAIRSEECTPAQWAERARKWKQAPTAMRKLWAKAHPERMTQAKQFGRKAVQAETIKRIDLALANAKAAQQLDPFNTSLASAIEKWSQPVDA